MQFLVLDQLLVFKGIIKKELLNKYDFMIGRQHGMKS